MSINPLDDIDGIPQLSEFAESELKYSEDREQEKEDSEYVPTEPTKDTFKINLLRKVKHKKNLEV